MSHIRYMMMIMLKIMMSRVRMRLIRFSYHVDIFKIGEKRAIGELRCQSFNAILQLVGNAAIPPLGGDRKCTYCHFYSRLAYNVIFKIIRW